MLTLEELANLLEENPRSTARELVGHLAATKREINSLLYSGLASGLFSCTDTTPPRWSAADPMQRPKAAPTDAGGSPTRERPYTSGKISRGGGTGEEMAARTSGTNTQRCPVPADRREPELGAWGPGGASPLPSWAEWFLDAGWCLAQRRERLKQWVVLTVPHRGFAAVLAAAGAVSRKLREEDPSNVHDRLAELRRGDPITWVDAQGDLASGRFVRVADGYVHYQKREHGRWGEARSRPIEMCRDFWPMDAGETPFSGSRPLLSNAEFVKAALPSLGAGGLAHCSTGAIVCGTQNQLLDELRAEVFSAGSCRGQLLDIVRPKGHLPVGQRAWSTLIASMTPAWDQPLCIDTGLAIFDGAQAYLRWRDSIDAPSNLVVIDRWDRRAEDVVPAARSDKQQAGVDEPVIGVPDLLAGIECFSWVEER